jgi:hypothetical protein
LLVVLIVLMVFTKAIRPDFEFFGSSYSVCTTSECVDPSGIFSNQGVQRYKMNWVLLARPSRSSVDLFNGRLQASRILTSASFL